MVVHFILSSLSLRVKFILVDVLGQRSQSSIENTVGIGMPPTSLHSTVHTEDVRSTISLLRSERATETSSSSSVR